MRLFSPAWHNGDALPLRFAAGRLCSDGRWLPGENLSPPLGWRDLPAACRSLALVCHDFDATAHALSLDAARNPTGAAGAAASEPARGDFFHWVLVDLPPELPGLDEGRWRQGFRAGGHPPAEWSPGAGPREGLNDYGRWFAGQPGLAGTYAGYDGPSPSPQDPVVHHLLFTLYALDLPRLPLPWPFTGDIACQAMAGHVLGTATLSGTCGGQPAGAAPQRPARAQQQAQNA